MQFVAKRDNSHRNHQFIRTYFKITASKASNKGVPAFEYRLLGRIGLRRASYNPRKKIYAIGRDVVPYIAIFTDYLSLLDGYVKSKFTLKAIEGQMLKRISH
jgi:hypothetical protein